MRRIQTVTPLLLLLLFSGCTGLINQADPPISRYLLEAPLQSQHLDPLGPTLLVSPTTAAPGYHSTDMLYLQTPHKLERFAHHQWADAPARMLQTLLVNQAESSGLFSAVFPQRLGLRPHLRLESELLSLHHSFLEQPSRIELQLRLQLIDSRDNHLIIGERITISQPASEPSPYAGVVAANHALLRIRPELEQLFRNGLQDWREGIKGDKQ